TGRPTAASPIRTQTGERSCSRPGSITRPPDTQSALRQWILQVDQLGQLAQGELEHGSGVVQREVQVAENRQADHSVPPHPAAQEDQRGAERQVRAERVPVAGQLLAQPWVDLVVGRDRERLLAPQLEEEGEEHPAELRGALGDDVQVLMQSFERWQRSAEQQPEFGLVTEAPVAELAARGNHLRGHVGASYLDRGLDALA